MSDDKQLEDKLSRSRNDLMNLRARLASGGSIKNPGQIKEQRRKIARILTAQNKRANNQE
jgi:ribosomal protein L29